MSEVEESKRSRKPSGGGGGNGDALYAIGIVGAGVYFWQRADTGQEKALAVAKAFVWPAFLVYQAFTLLEGASTVEAE